VRAPPTRRTAPVAVPLTIVVVRGSLPFIDLQRAATSMQRPPRKVQATEVLGGKRREGRWSCRNSQRAISVASCLGTQVPKSRLLLATSRRLRPSRWSDPTSAAVEPGRSESSRTRLFVKHVHTRFPRTQPLQRLFIRFIYLVARHNAGIIIHEEKNARC
jgi:hypothetical protein